MLQLPITYLVTDPELVSKDIFLVDFHRTLITTE